MKTKKEDIIIDPEFPGITFHAVTAYRYDENNPDIDLGGDDKELEDDE
jgi:hypothetical protein